jgi:hypothetical protein
MDFDRFDALARSVIVSGSRRHALALAVGGVLTPLLACDEAGAHDPLKKCKKINDQGKRKQCLKKAKKHAAQHAADQAPSAPVCTPSCTGRSCGDDGCGGSCGPCSGGSCDAGTCLCPDGTSCVAGQACQATMEGVICFPQGICAASTEGSLCQPAFTVCDRDGTGDCSCIRSAEGNIVCVQRNSMTACAHGCNASTDCEPGLACVDISGCCGGLPAGSMTCMAPCESPVRL